MDRRALLGGTPMTPLNPASMGEDFFTNAELRTQDGNAVRFYDDIIKDRFVAINFIYTNCEGICPLSTAALVQVQKLLAKRAGSDVSLCSITLKPWEDGPAELKAYAKAHGAKWTFLTGSDYDLTTLRFRLFRWEHPALDFNLEQHTGMVRIINDRLNRWSMVPTLATPAQIVAGIDWAAPTKPLAIRQQEGYAIRGRLQAEQRRWMSRETLARAG
ncbi:MAG: SCO family protein [Gammaproteobacteria bacterium]